eukprot:1173562-Prorocentrum_minimum.AAC.1
MSTCIAVVVYELAELSALRYVLRRVHGELEGAELRLGVPCRIGGLGEEFSQESEEGSAPVAVVG